MAQIILANLTDLTNVVPLATQFPTTTGSANAQTATYSPPLPSPPGGMQAGYAFAFQAGFTNTGAMTLTVVASGSSFGPFNVLREGSALANGDIRLNGAYIVIFDGTNFNLFEGGQVVNVSKIVGLAAVATSGSAADLTTGTLAAARLGGMSVITNSLGGNVALNNTATYFDGPSVAQGTSGTWFVSGTVTLVDTGGAATFQMKLWDGTTVIASTSIVSTGASAPTSVSLSGSITSPAGNLRISARDTAATTGLIVFNNTGNSKDSTITAIRIG